MEPSAYSLHEDAGWLFAAAATERVSVRCASTRGTTVTFSHRLARRVAPAPARAIGKRMS
jgi:hypothetical protein